MQESQLLVRLLAFGDDLQSEILGQRDYRHDDRGVGGIGRSITYEGLIDLQSFDWKTLESEE